MKNKRFLILVTIVCLALVVVMSLLPSCAGGPAAPTPATKPIELRHSDIHPQDYPLAQVNLDYMKEIETATKGAVKFTFFGGGSLTTAAEVYEGVVKGVSDTGMSVLAYSPGRFPVMASCDLAGNPSPDPRVSAHVAWDVYNKFKPAEFNDVHVLFLWNFAPGFIITRDKPIYKLEDLKGLRIRCTGTSAAIVEALGAVPVSLPITEAYTLLQKGTVDGSLCSADDLIALKFADICKYSVLCSAVGYTACFFEIMNLDKWNSLPADIKKVFDEISPKYVEIFGAKVMDMNIGYFKEAKAAGHTFINLPPEEMARWAAVVIKPLEDKYVADLEAKGLPGREILAYRHEREKYWSEKLGPVPSP